MRVKPRSLYRGLYFSKKPQTYFPAVTLRQQGEDSRLCRARRHFAGGLDSREADRKAGLHKHSGASGLKIRARCLTQQQPWALERLGNSLLRQTHWLTSQRLPSILSEWQETPPPPPGAMGPPPAPCPSCSQESQGPGERVGGSASPSPPWKQNTKPPSSLEHRPASLPPFKEPGGGRHTGSIQGVRSPQPRPDSRGQRCQEQVSTATAPGPGPLA